MVEKIIIGALIGSNAATVAALVNSKKKYNELLVKKEAITIYASNRLGCDVEKALYEYCASKQLTVYDMVLEEKQKKADEELKKLEQQNAQQQIAAQPQNAVPVQQVVQPQFVQQPTPVVQQPNFTIIDAAPQNIVPIQPVQQPAPAPVQ